MLFFKVIRRFYRAVLAATGVNFLYHLGEHKGNREPMNSITGKTYLDAINSYLEVFFETLKKFPMFLYNLTHLNYGFITSFYYLVLIIAFVFLMYFLVALYSFFINLIDKTFLKKYDYPVCNNCKEKVALNEKTGKAILIKNENTELEELIKQNLVMKQDLIDFQKKVDGKLNSLNKDINIITKHSKKVPSYSLKDLVNNSN
jgi:hypothetical protein